MTNKEQILQEIFANDPNNLLALHDALGISRRPEDLLTIEWCYDDYLAVTNRIHSEDTAERWVKIIDLIEIKFYEDINEVIRNTIETVDEELEDE